MFLWSAAVAEFSIDDFQGVGIATDTTPTPGISQRLDGMNCAACAEQHVVTAAGSVFASLVAVCISSTAKSKSCPPGTNLNCRNVSSVTNMTRAFTSKGQFNKPLAGCWDVSSVKSMDKMFLGAAVFNQPITSVITSGYFDGGKTNFMCSGEAILSFTGRRLATSYSHVPLWKTRFIHSVLFQNKLLLKEAPLLSQLGS